MASLHDQQLFLWINADRGWVWFDTCMAVLSSLDFWMPFLVLAAVLVLWRGGFRARTMLICLALSIAVVDGLVANPLKKAFGRPRPTQVLAEARSVDLAGATPRFLAVAQPLRIKPAKVGTEERPTGKSFPSAHTANTFCLATILTSFYGRRAAWAFGVAALVGLSRVATGSHWPSDVIFSAALGVVLSLVLLRLYAWAWLRLAPRVCPALTARHPAWPAA